MLVVKNFLMFPVTLVLNLLRRSNELLGDEDHMMATMGTKQVIVKKIQVTQSTKITLTIISFFSKTEK